MRIQPAKIRQGACALWAIATVLLLLWPDTSGAQFAPGGFGGGGFGGGGRRGGGRRGNYNYYSLNGQQEREQETMQNAIDPAFADDVFTFARLNWGEHSYGYGGRSWNDDSPQADLCMIYRLYEGTSLIVKPALRSLNVVEITTNQLAANPFVYMAGAGGVDFSDADAACLRQYLLTGGFIMVDDFWGVDQWNMFYAQLKKIFPDREPEELTLDHPIFRTVFKFKKLPQIPSAGSAYQSWEARWRYDSKITHDPHYFAMYDDKKRMVMLICLNNHYGDGWEHEGDDEEYFAVYSEQQAYPMLINIITYAMTH